MKKVILHEKWSDGEEDYRVAYECYEVGKKPEEREYFNYGKDKGYVIQVIEEEIAETNYSKYTLYYEKELDQWNNQEIDVPEVCSIAIRK